MAKAIVRGDKEIIANMRRVRNSVGGRFLDVAMRESLDPMRAETVQNARQRRQVGYNPPGGHLDEGVRIARKESKGLHNKVYWIAFAKRARKIAHLVEYGTAPHYQPRRGVMHPGARPYPFFRPAFESTKRETVDRLSAVTWARIRSTLLQKASR